MKKLSALHPDERTWLIKWAFYPLLVYYLSSLGLYLMPLVFLLLLTLVQWKRLQRLTNHADAGFWVLIVFLYAALTWLASHGYFINWYSTENWLAPETVAHVALIYYGAQLIGGFFIKLLTAHWHWQWYLGSNVLAALVWLGGVPLFAWCLTRYIAPDDVALLWLCMGLPLLGLLSNTIVGIGLLQAVAAPAVRPLAATESL